MFKAYPANGSSARMTAGVKTALLVLVLGIIAVIADVSLNSPRALLLEDARGVPAEVAAIDSRVLPASIDVVPVRSHPRGNAGNVSADPSVPAAASSPLSQDEIQPPTF